MSDQKAMVLTGLLLLGVATVSLACRCTSMLPSEHVCSSDFAIKVLVERKIGTYEVQLANDLAIPPIDMTIYHVQVQHVLKATPAFETLRNKHVLTVQTVCEKILEEGHIYVIAANVNVPETMRPFMVANNCNYIMDVDTEDPESHQEVTDLLNTSNFGCDTERPVNENTSKIVRMLRKLWDREQ